jgi:cytidine deaminase
MSDQLFQAARHAMAHSHSPYSKFPVGAAILAGNGRIYSGCNIENAAYPLGSCAEASAISAMVSDGQKEIVEIAVIAEKMDEVTPCGGCRQRIAEFAKTEALVHLCDANGITTTLTLGELLPRSFGLES